MTTQNDPLPEALRAHVRTVAAALEQSGVDALARHGIIRDREGQIADMRAGEGMSDDAILASLDAPGSFAEAYTGKVPRTGTYPDPPTAARRRRWPGRRPTRAGRIPEAA